MQIVKQQQVHGYFICSQARDVARGLVERTSYEIIPKRTMFPERFHYPPEAKGKMRQVQTIKTMET